MRSSLLWHTSLLVLGLCALADSTARAAERPNFIVILSDDQSWVGSSLQIVPEDDRTRSDYFQTPHIERLAAMGMRFTQGYAPAASCCPTRRAIQVGQAPARHEYQADREAWTQVYRTQLNIPRMLKAADSRYQAAHFGKWDHRYDNLSPFEQGYDFSDGYTGNNTGGAKKSGGPAATPDPKRIDTITDQALHFIDRSHHTGTPFYLQISHYAVHLDIYYNQSTFDRVKQQSPGRKHNMPEFAAMTADLDDGIGRILDRLIKHDLLRNTWLIFLSDNGGRNGIPGAPEKQEHRNAPLRDGKHSFYEGGIRVPFIVLGPEVPAGTVSRVPVSGVDILPTLADLAGYPNPLPDNIDGGSMRPVLNGTGLLKRANPFLVFHQAVERRPMSALRQGQYKLVKLWEENSVELFDLSQDVSEVSDLSAAMPDKTQQMHTMLMDYLTDVGAETRRTIQKRRKRAIPTN